MADYFAYVWKFYADAIKNLYRLIQIQFLSETFEKALLDIPAYVPTASEAVDALRVKTRPTTDLHRHILSIVEIWLNEAIPYNRGQVRYEVFQNPWAHEDIIEYHKARNTSTPAQNIDVIASELNVMFHGYNDVYALGGDTDLEVSERLPVSLQARMKGIKVQYTIPSSLRTQHHQIIANSGHGKTQCIQSMIMDDWGTDASIVVIDSQGDLINNLLAHTPHLDRVVLIDPETCPPSMNIFANKAKGEYELATAIELFEYIFSALDVKLTGQQSLVYRYLSRLLMDIPGATIETMRDLLQPGGTAPYQEYIDQLGGNAKAFFDEFQKEKNNQYAETKQAVLRRLLMVLESETFSKMLASEKMAFDFPDLLDSGKIILISTSKRLLKDGSSLFGRIFIALVMQAVMARKGKRRRTYLYIDEFADYAEDSQVLFNLFEQARKYELGMVVCHQYLGQLPQQLARSMSANTAIKFAGGVSAEDARALASQMQTKPEAIQAEEQFSFHAWFKGQRATSWKIKPGRLEALPQHSERDLDQFRDQMRMMYGSRRGTVHRPPPPDVEEEPERW